MSIAASWASLERNKDSLRQAGSTRNPRVLWSLVGPAVRGFVLRHLHARPEADVRAHHDAHFDFRYRRTEPEMARLYTKAKEGQWSPDTALDWTQAVDPHDAARELMDVAVLPLAAIPSYHSLPRREQEKQRHAVLAWLLSQALHGEQGALFAACQLTEAVPGLDAKLYGSTQVVDEGRHVEVFHRYLTTKLEKLYDINDNLYVLVDGLMSDGRWDLKFLGMQILIEGLALGTFSTLRQHTREPLLKELLRYVITDEARHVHFGVVALEARCRDLDPRELREREDWAFEMALLMRNRFLAHEFYDEYYGHTMSRAQWDRAVLDSPFMQGFRRSMFKRIVPNLRRIGLLSERMRPYYASIGVLDLEHEKAAPELSAEDLLS